MSDQFSGHLEAGPYEIRIQGHLGARWAAWFDGLSLTNEPDGTTLIRGPVTDQSALHGLLQKVRDLGLPLVSVTQAMPTTPIHPPSRRTRRRPIDKENDMTVLDRTPARTRVPMSSLRKNALVAGALYLITFATSIPARVLFGPVRNDPSYVLGPGPADTQILFAGLLDVLMAFACIGTAVALYPVVKRQNRGVALGFVGSRTLEAAIIVTGVVALLSVVTLRQAGAGADALGASHALVAMYNWTFLFGPGFMACVNALLLGSLLYRSGLVPRIIPLVGLIGAPLLFASDLAVMFGLWAQGSLPAGIAVVPIALWEVSLGVWLVVKGFRPSPITAEMTTAETRPDYPAVTRTASRQDH